MIDGDTIRVRHQGKNYTVRLIGVDAPETKHPTKAVQYFGREASAGTKAALEGKTVLLQKDRTGDTVDRYALASLRPPGRRQLQRPAHPRRLRSCLPALSLHEADGVYSTGRTSEAGAGSAYGTAAENHGFVDSATGYNLRDRAAHFPHQTATLH